ncbi:hypothetical protein EYC84_011089 [Monilinia fructicola]|uniref:Uncharacterized protein n=1 Tax=Monilinia fructicola TaxID=38448 RepID=A0A5M9JBZ2_MONFR|nr:hypothetical protein EYC84_011089 [Monilinia fructicola]
MSDGGTSMITVTAEASVTQATRAGLSTIFLTLTTMVPSFTLLKKSPTTSVSSIDTTVVALSSIASYNSVQATATDPWTKDHLSYSISQYTSWARLSSGYTDTRGGSRSTAMSDSDGGTPKDVDTTMATIPSITLPSIAGTDLNADALSEILSYESIGATATDTVLKGELRSEISQLSKLATLTDGAFANQITIWPSEQSAVDQSNREGTKKQQLYTGLIALAVALVLILVTGTIAAYFVRMRRRRTAKNFPSLTQYASPDLSSFGGLMAEMGREGTVGEQDRITEVFQRVPGVPKTQSGLREAEIPEGIVELPGSTPEIEPRKTDASGSLEGVEDLEKLCCELGGK